MKVALGPGASDPTDQVDVEEVGKLLSENERTKLSPAMWELAFNNGMRGKLLDDHKRSGTIEEENYYTRLRETYMYNQVLLFATGTPDMLFTILHQLAALQAPAIKKLNADTTDSAATRKPGRYPKNKLVAAGDANAKANEKWNESAHADGDGNSTKDVMNAYLTKED